MNSKIGLIITVMTSPIWLSILILLSILIFICDGRPVFFVQNRAGLNNQPFKILKLRTMRVVSDQDKIFDANLITKLGAVLRRSSLDELPQLFNVILGQMTLVGPRPLYLEYISTYTHQQSKRLSVKPGITGLSQVMVRNDANWNRKIAYDVIYVQKKTFCLDCYILLLTVLRLIKPKGIVGLGNKSKNI